ncbi:MAG: DUF3427 domain-containing protein [Moraxella sp.]|nr:DUF3427 domain-containing protein [Moraxella sp.]
MLFKIGHKYSRVSVLDMIEVPKDSNGNRGGIYSNGYFKFKDSYYLFVNIGVEGRTGHNYDNKFIDSSTLFWYAKNNTKLHQNQIQELLNNQTKIHIFYREENRDNFTYAGMGKAASHQDTSPVQITWQINQ